MGGQTPSRAVTVRRRLFVAGAVVLFGWTACVELAIRAGPSARVAAAPGRADAIPAGAAAAVANPVRARPMPAVAVAAPPRGPARTAANDAGDPAAAGPAAVEDPGLTSLVRRWCAAYVRWGRDPSPGSGASLRSLSMPRLYASLVAHPPIAPTTPVPAETISGVQTFAAIGGFSAIVDLRGDGVDVALELMITRTPAGARVSQFGL